MQSCANCKSPLVYGAQFCGNCGAKVEASMPPAAANQAVSSPPANTNTAQVNQTLPNNPATTAGNGTPVSASAAAVAPTTVGSRPGNGQSIASLVLGIVALPAALFGIVGITFGAIGLTFGIIGRGKSHSGIALAGIVISAIAIMLSVLSIVVALVLRQSDAAGSTSFLMSPF